ncbi:hypothetical protein O5O45_14285 [Hahella aquimaris]|uniref:hypothetical protein n=1 Tax=Hahella sp. HNIBRBA332 TaxID=3015983 RepID=UPI00273A8D70|nr:hypothetical protein [Hahella sp. HNIBRBA332]WLQ17085.1 hypothetical protein O5O45_14285 [Hahella sp. HNIBRBA332]
MLHDRSFLLKAKDALTEADLLKTESPFYASVLLREAGRTMLMPDRIGAACWIGKSYSLRDIPSSQSRYYARWFKDLLDRLRQERVFLVYNDDAPPQMPIFQRSKFGNGLEAAPDCAELASRLLGELNSDMAQNVKSEPASHANQTRRKKQAALMFE